MKNEFTIKGPDGKGSRGSSPARYATQYMARDLATEQVTPVRKNSMDDFVQRYFLRESATDKAIEYNSEPSSYNGFLLTSPPTPVQTEQEAGPGDEPLPPRRRKTLRERRRERSEARRQRKADRMKARMARKEVTSDTSETDDDSLDENDLKAEFRKAQGKGGLAFGYGEISLSHDSLVAASNDIQRMFDEGKTIFKTVISFDQEYLRLNKIVDPSLGDDISAGDYRGNIDQLKLRRAITHGLDRMSRSQGYDDLRWIGVIQVDTEHVHCHLVMGDAGRGLVTKDGTQKGKLTQKSMSQLRRGIDSVLDEQKEVAYLSSQVGIERSNVVSWLRRWTYESIHRESDPQFILSLLPENKNLWRASTNAKVMKRPNRLVTELVERRLARPGSPMPTAMAKVRHYADTRALKERLGNQERDRLVEEGRRRIVEKCVNSVYRELGKIKDEEKTTSTEMMRLMGSDFDDLMAASVVSRKATGDTGADEHSTDKPDQEELSQEEFALRIQSYSARLAHHRARRNEFTRKKREWEKADRLGQASVSSRVMYDFYRVEEDYHRKVEAKYMHFMQFETRDRDWQKDWKVVEEYGRRLTRLKQLREDDTVARIKDPEQAERYGRELYGMSGGHQLAGGLTVDGQRVTPTRIVDKRIATMEMTYQNMVDEVVENWSAAGARPVVVDPSDTSTGLRRILDSELSDEDRPFGDVDIYTPGARVAVSFTPEFAFTDVKGLDMQDMRYERLSDSPVGDRTRSLFMRMAARREAAVESARLWMENTEAGDEVDAELGEALGDVAEMKAVVSEVLREGVLRSRLRQQVDQINRQRALEDVEGEIPSGVTVPPDKPLRKSLNRSVDMTVVAESDSDMEF